jgi:hypothetical protein
MKVITTEKVLLVHDREGQLIEHVQIDLRITNKDDVNKLYTLEAIDSIVLNKGEENESTVVLRNRHGVPQVKTYQKTYAEYDEQKEVLLSIYGEETELKGSELEDFLLQKGLLYNLVSDNIYDGKWEAR